LRQAGVPRATIDSLFASSLYATRSPDPLDRAWPLVLVAQGNGQDVADQVVLCEYLASQGFIVAAPPSPTLRMALEREDQVGAVAETQADDLAAAVGAVAGVLRVDAQRLGVVGHSFGARAALLLAMRDTSVRALVSLDGGIGTATALEPFRHAPSFRADAPLPPLLLFFEELDAFMTPDFGLVRSLHTAELILVPTDAMHHVHFTTYGFAAARFPGVATVTHATPGTASAVKRIAERTGDFLLRRLR
jgi:dienelactone hydrolase